MPTCLWCVCVASHIIIVIYHFPSCLVIFTPLFRPYPTRCTIHPTPCLCFVSFSLLFCLLPPFPAPTEPEPIELCAALYDVRGARLEDAPSFHCIIKPTLHPVLAESTTKLTGVTQQMIDEHGVSLRWAQCSTAEYILRVEFVFCSLLLWNSPVPIVALRITLSVIQCSFSHTRTLTPILAFCSLLVLLLSSSPQRGSLKLRVLPHSARPHGVCIIIIFCFFCFLLCCPGEARSMGIRDRFRSRSVTYTAQGLSPLWSACALLV